MMIKKFILVISLLTNIIDCTSLFSAIKEGMNSDQNSNSSTTNSKNNKYSRVSKNYFSVFGFKKIIKELETVISDENLVEQIILEEMFPNLIPSECLKIKNESEEYVENCQTKMYEITDHNNGKSNIDKLPTILILGGLKGDGTLDKSVIIQFMISIQKQYHEAREWYFLLNNLRLLVIPFLNSPLIYEEAALIESSKDKLKKSTYNKEFNYENDFDLNLDGKCFKSFPSQVLNELHHKYLIMGTIYINNKPAGLSIPRLKEVFNTFLPKLDDEFYEHVSQELLSTYNKLDYDDHTKLELISEKMDADKIRNPNFIEWSHGNSTMKKLISDVCFHKNNPYRKQYVKPNDYSHRSFAIELSLGRSDDSSRHMYAGNELILVDFLNEDAKKGSISAAIGLIRNFLEIMRPFVSFNKVIAFHEKNNTNEKLMKSITVSGVIKGCMESPNFDNNIKGGKRVRSSIKLNPNLTSSSYIFDELVVIDTNSNLDNNEKMNISYDFECLNHWKNKKTKINSHFLKLRMDHNYKILKKNIVYESIHLSKYKLMNVSFESFGESLIFQKYKNEAVFFDDNKLYLQIGNLFAFELVYNNIEKSVNILLKKHSVEKYLEQISKNKSSFTNHMPELAMMNHLNNSSNNKIYVDNLDLILNDNKNLFFSVYNGEQNLIKFEVEDIIDSMNDDLSRKIKGQESEKNAHDEKSKPRIYEEINLDEKKESLYNTHFDKNKNNPMVKKMRTFLRISYINQIKKILSKNFFIQSDLTKSIPLLQSQFLDLLGKPATIWLETDKALESEKLPLSNEESFEMKFYMIHKKRNIKRLNGVIVKRNYNLFEDNKLPSPETQNIKAISKPIQLPLNGIHCSNFNPMNGVNQSGIEEKLKYYSLNQIKNFPGYSISIIPNSSNIKKTKITILTTLRSMPDFLTLQVKNNKFKVMHSTKMINLQGLDKALKEPLYIYYMEVMTKNIPIAGEYIQILDKEKLVFDCFPYTNFNDFDQNETIKIFYRTKQKIMHLFMKLEQESRENEIFYKIFLIISSEYFLIPLLILIISGLGFFLYQSADKDDLKKPMNDVENGNQEDSEVNKENVPE